jgi:GxxExxY protein
VHLETLRRYAIFLYQITLVLLSVLSAIMTIKKLIGKKNMLTQKYINNLAYKIVGCAIEVHKNLGPGLLESIYETCLIEELSVVGLVVKSQLFVPIKYKNKDLGGTLKLDLLVNDLIIIELKAVDLMIPLFKAQLLSYLKLTGKPKGLLINFHCENIVEQMVPLVTDEFSKLPK